MSLCDRREMLVTIVAMLKCYEGLPVERVVTDEAGRGAVIWFDVFPHVARHSQPLLSFQSNYNFRSIEPLWRTRPVIVVYERLFGWRFFNEHAVPNSLCPTIETNIGASFRAWWRHADRDVLHSSSNSQISQQYYKKSKITYHLWIYIHIYIYIYIYIELPCCIHFHAHSGGSGCISRMLSPHIPRNCMGDSSPLSQSRDLK